MRNGSSLSIQAGAGIVHDSVPENEFNETESKMLATSKVIEPFLGK